MPIRLRDLLANGHGRSRLFQSFLFTLFKLRVQIYMDIDARINARPRSFLYARGCTKTERYHDHPGDSS